MSNDPVDDILGYLGLGPTPEPTRTAARPAPVGSEQQIAASGRFSLWRASNEQAEWVEVRGASRIVRATRPKARLLLSLAAELEKWAIGGKPTRDERALRIRVVYKWNEYRLEISYQKWKPIRLCRKQARGWLQFASQIAEFVKEAT